MPQTQEEQGFVVVNETSGIRSQAVRPQDIKIRDTGAAGRFGKHEVEMAAGRLLAFFQEMGRWGKFTLTQLLNFYQAKGWNPDMMFFGLLGVWYDDSMMYMMAGRSPWLEAPVYLVLDDSGCYRITDLYIRQCMED